MTMDEWSIIFWLLAVCIFSYIGYDDGKKTIVNELCNIKV